MENFKINTLMRWVDHGKTRIIWYVQKYYREQNDAEGVKFGNKVEIKD